jgi:hypothetical protein
MKWLCICQYGHSRSVALTRVLHGKQVGAVAVGYATNGGALALLAAWADVIAVMQPEYSQYVPEEFRHKITNHFDVGPDRWSNPYNQELLNILMGLYASFNIKAPE